MNTTHAPIQLEGPYLSRRTRLAHRAMRALRTLAIAACVLVGLPVTAGVLYALYLLGSGQ